MSSRHARVTDSVVLERERTIGKYMDDVFGTLIWDFEAEVVTSSPSFGREVGLGLSSCTVSGTLCARLRTDRTRGTSMLRLLLLVRTNELMSPLTT